MATTIPPPEPEALPLPKRPKLSGAGNTGGHDFVPVDGSLRAVDQFSPAPSSSAIWVGIAAICMSFAALTSALIVRQGASSDWRHINLPPILFFSTLVILVSSGTLELARRHVAAFMTGRATHVEIPRRWLYLTLGLGLLFVASQYMAWLQLRSQGLYFATNPKSSCFYLFTSNHALHVLGGLAGLLRVIIKLSYSTLRRSTLDATAYYWHFMGVLWVYLFVLLWMRI